LEFTDQKSLRKATIHYLFKRPNLAAFEGALREWIQRCRRTGSKAVAVGGETLRSIASEQRSGVHLLAAYVLFQPCFSKKWK